MRRLVLVLLFACGSRTQLDTPLGPTIANGSLRPLAPLSTSTVTTRRPTFHWTSGAAQVEVCPSRACGTIEATATGQSGSATLTTDLSPGVHFFRLHPIVSGVPTTDTTAVWEFRVPHRSAPRDTSWGVFPDFDGDGFADLVVRPLITPFVTEIYPGSPTSIAQDRRVDVVTPDPKIVNVMAAVGDVDGDGFGDLAIGRAGLAPSTNGVVYIYRGGPKGIDASKPSVTIDPPSGADGSTFGVNVASAGDLNGDGYADLVVTTQQQAPSNAKGVVFVYFGGPSGPSTTPAITLHSDENLDFGAAAAEAGDVDGDGFADLVVISETLQLKPHVPRVYLYRGSATGPSDATRSLLVAPTDDNSCLRLSPTPADFDGDGLADVTVGFLGCDNPIGPGVLAVFFGGSTPRATVVPPAGFSGFGFEIQAGGDINGDGFDDLTATMNLGASTGAAIFWGSQDGISQSNETTFDVSVDPKAASAYGLTVSDLDGDALDDVTVAPITASPITVFSDNGSMSAKASVTPPGAAQFYEPILR